MCPKTTSEIVIYKDHLAQCNKKLKVCEMTDLSIVEVKDTSEVNPLKEQVKGCFKCTDGSEKDCIVYKIIIEYILVYFCALQLTTIFNEKIYNDSHMIKLT